MSKQKNGRDERGKADPNDPWGEVAGAAVALEHELRKFEQEATAARKIRMDTRRELERAAKAAGEAAQGQERVNTTLATLVQAIQTARLRHEENVRTLEARGEEIRSRADALSPLYERFASIGEESRAVNTLVQQAAAMQKEAAATEQLAELVTFVEGIEERMVKIEGDARELGKDAAQASASDVSEQCDSLRQQVASARNKLGILRKGLQAMIAARPMN